MMCAGAFLRIENSEEQIHDVCSGLQRTLELVFRVDFQVFMKSDQDRWVPARSAIGFIRRKLPMLLAAGDNITQGLLNELR